MKNLSTAYKNHTALNSTTLCKIILIERKDGTQYAFTDHDKDVEVGSIIYKASNSFIPTDFQNAASLAVDNIDITGIISEIEGITEKDIYKEFFYDARVWLSEVNYNSTGDGTNKILYGSFGEVTLQENTYSIEFRNLTYILTRNLANVFSKTCRVELGSIECGVNLEPSNWVDQTVYCTGAQVSSKFYTGRRYIVTTPGTSASPLLTSDDYVTYIKKDANIVSNWSLEEDPYYAEVKLLSHMDGTDTSTTFIDETGKTMTAGGNAQLKTGDKQFGTASAYFDGSGDYVQIPTSADWDWTTTTTSFTAEAWIKVSSFQDWRAIFGWYSNGLTDGWRLLVGANGTFHLATDSGGLGGFWINNAITLNTWHHVAMVIQNDQTVSAFVDGVLVGTGGVTSFTPPTVAFCIGANDTGASFPFHGYIDEVRITKGVARYTANFTPPSRAFESEGPTNVVDGSGSNTGTYINTPTLYTPTILPDDAGGGYAVTFDKSSTEYISVPAAASINNFFAGGARTLETWIKPSSAIGTDLDHAWVMGKDEAGGTYGTTRTGWAIQYYGTPGYQYIAFFQRFDDGISTVTNTHARTPIGSVLPNSVYHVVVTYDGSSPSNTMEIWLNGVKQTLTVFSQATVGHTASDDSGAALTIGNCDPTATNTRLWDGVIDEVSMYNVKLSDAEIEKHYNLAIDNREPVWNNTIDGTTNDGTIVWTTKDAYVKQGVLTTGTKIRMDMSALNSLDSYFRLGELYFYDENNNRHIPSGILDNISELTTPTNLFDGSITNYYYGAAGQTNTYLEFTFASAFKLASFSLFIDSQTWLPDLTFSMSFDGGTTWTSIYSKVNMTKRYWSSISNNLSSSDIFIYGGRIIPESDLFADMRYVKRGVLTWLTGDNANTSVEIKSYDATNNVIYLLSNPTEPISFTDTFEISAGCNHIFPGTCVSRYNNGLNFRGEPHVPTEDVLIGGIGETNKEPYVS